MLDGKVIIDKTKMVFNVAQRIYELMLNERVLLDMDPYPSP